jgi:hypothetical protein
LSDDGKLIGVNAFKAEGEALNFAVAITDVRRFLAATNSVISSNRALASQSGTNECTGTKVVYEGRDKADDAFIRSVSLKCDDFTDIVFVLPDNKTKPMYALFDSKRSKRTDAIIFDPSRTGNWKFSYWDINLEQIPVDFTHSLHA